MKLSTALQNVRYDNSWGVYAEKIDGQFNVDSPARYGETLFENGGLLDDMEFVCNGEAPSNWAVEWCGEDEVTDDVWDDLDVFVDEINESQN